MKSCSIDGIPSGAKAPDFIGHFAVRLKSCPDASCTTICIFPEAVKSCPDTSCYSGGIFPQTVKPGPFKIQTDSAISDSGIIQEKL